MKRGEKKMLNGFGKSRRRLLFFVLAGLLMVTGQGALREAIAADPTSENLINCSIQQGPCTKDLRGMTVTLDILPKPVMAMKDLKFQVILSGEKPTANPYIDLGMPGMDMGPNRVELRAVKDSVYEGQGIIVRCPSGRRTWKAIVYLPLGLLLGLLPCGPVYTALIASARAGMAADSSLQSFLSGMGLMLAFGIGTIPALFLVGKLAGLGWIISRDKIFKISSVLMILVGIYFIIQGIHY